MTKKLISGSFISSQKRHWVVITIAALAMALIFSGTSGADQRLIIKDSAGTSDVFSVEDTGATSISGQDSANSFQTQIFGKANGDSHVQLGTGLANSRMTIIAAEANDAAPRLQFIGPQDVTPASQGWAILDFGSARYPVSNALFRIRYFPGTATPATVFEVLKDEQTRVYKAGTGNTVFAYSDGTGWFTSSSREIKKDIAELTKEDASIALASLKPVKFKYKNIENDKQRVGFIAEEVPEFATTKDKKGVSSLEIVAVLTKVVKEQNETISNLQKKIEELELKYNQSYSPQQK